MFVGFHDGLFAFFGDAPAVQREGRRAGERVEDEAFSFEVFHEGGRVFAQGVSGDGGVSMGFQEVDDFFGFHKDAHPFCLSV